MMMLRVRKGFDGHCHFYFGSDTAPHPRNAKERVAPAAGIFSAPVATACQVQFFDENNALDSRFSDFTAVIGPEFYGFSPSAETIELIKEMWTVPEEYDGIVPFMAVENDRYFFTPKNRREGSFLF